MHNRIVHLLDMCDHKDLFGRGQPREGGAGPSSGSAAPGRAGARADSTARPHPGMRDLPCGHHEPYAHPGTRGQALPQRLIKR